MAGPNILNFNSKVVFLGGTALTLPVIASDPGSASQGDLYYNSTSKVIRYYNGTAWANVNGGTGTVTSVALADGSTTPIYSISGSPVTTSGTLTSTLVSQSANTVFAGPNGASGQPSFRALVASDIPSLTGSYASTTLNNLGTTAINASLVPGTTATYNIGSTTGTWLNAYISSLNDASNNASVSVFNRQLFDVGGNQAIDWGNRLLKSSSAVTQASWSSSGFQLGVSSTTAGNLILANATNAFTTTINAAATVTASYNFNLPSTAGTAGQVLTSQGGGSSAMTWSNAATGTVTAVSVASANGFAGTSSGGATPALTLSTTITGVLKGNGTAISAATAGTDYVIPSGSITGTAGNITATSNSTLTTLSALSLPTTQLTGTLQAAQEPAHTGDVTNTAGSLALTLATVATAGTTGSSTAIPVITINAKGLTTSISTAAVIAPAGTLSGTTLNSTVTASSLTSLGTQAAALNMGSHQINNLAMAGSPASTDATNVTYVATQIANAINGLTWKGPVSAFASSNTALTGGATLTIDGYSVQNGNYVILSSQTTSSQQGVYLASGIGTAYTLTLQSSGSEAATATGDAYLIQNGTVYGNTAVQVSALSPTTFIQFAGPNTYTFTSPLLLTGNVVSIGYDNSTIGLSGGNLVVLANGIGTTQLASSAVTYAKIQNVTAGRLLGNPTGSAAAPSEIALGATLTFVGSALQTAAMTGDVTSTANSFATTVAKIAGTTVSGTTGSGNVVFSASPTLTGTITAAAANFSGAIGANSGITSTGALLINANAGASALQIEALNVQRSTNGTNFVTETYVDSTTLTDNSGPTAVTAFQFTTAAFAGIEITYVIESGDANADCRVGTIRATANASGTITPSLSDMYTESADCGVSWTATNSGGTISVNYTTTSQGSNRTMRADVKFIRR